MEPKAESLEETMKTMLEKIPKRTTTTNPFAISRVPELIIQDRKDRYPYKPLMVPIGPYHRDESRFQEMEKHKLLHLRDFLERNTLVNLDAYIKEIRSVKDFARSYYCAPLGKISTDDEFVRMLLLDGCFILELALKLGNKQHCICWAGWDFMTILSDLLLIENQMPFFVLERLYAVLNNQLDCYKSPVNGLKTLLVNNLFVQYLMDSVQSSRVNGSWGQPINHLLHLYHELSLPYTETNNGCSDASRHSAQRQKNYRLPQVIPSATQLFEFGFALRKQDPTNDCNMNFMRIWIPQLIVDSSRQTLLMNLLAFEHGLEENKRRWTGLMAMMNCLVKNKSDLDILQQSGIVLNLLPSEDELIQFLSQLSKRVASDFNNHYYSELFEQINHSCESYIRQKRARCMHKYFNNRLAALSFVCSLAAILVSSVQALVSVYTYRRRFH